MIRAKAPGLWSDASLSEAAYDATRSLTELRNKQDAGDVIIILRARGSMEGGKTLLIEGEYMIGCNMAYVLQDAIKGATTHE